MSRARDNANLGTQAGSGLDASDITSGALPVGVTGGSGLNALSASNLSAGTVPDARFPATLPAASGTNLTALPADELSGTITSGTQDAITRLGTVTAGNLSNTAIVYPAGHIIKLYSKTYTSTHQVGVSSNWTTVGLATTNNLDITMDTPVSSSSKYFIQVNLLVSDSPSNTLDFRLIDGSSNHIIRGDTAGSRNRSFIGLGHQSTGNGSNYHLRNGVGSYLWSPGSASSQQIILQGTNHAGTQAFYINRSNTDNDADWISRSVSTMTVMEIAG